MKVSFKGLFLNGWTAYLLLFLMLFPTCTPKKQKQHLEVFAAASLAEVMSAMGDGFKGEKALKVSFNFASSGTLARQIQMGAGADIFISANKQWVDFLVAEDVIKPGHFAEVAGNNLVLISGSDKEMSLSEAIKGRFVIGDPLTVPAGNYAKIALENLGLWTDKHSFLYGRDVKHVLKLVEIRESDAGIVYKTDVFDNRNITVLQELPDSLYPAIKYYICDMTSGASSDAKAFIAYVKSIKGKSVWESYGFKSIQ